MRGRSTPIFRQLRLLIACLVLALVARPVATSLETPRAVAAQVASSSAPAPKVAPSRVTALRALLLTAFDTKKELRRAALVAPAFELGRPRPPLYLQHQRFLL